MKSAKLGEGCLNPALNERAGKAVPRSPARGVMTNRLRATVAALVVMRGRPASSRVR